jgi:hypothetical protein
LKTIEKTLNYEPIGFDKSRTDYGYSLYILGLILMVVVALVAQTISTFSIAHFTDGAPISSQRELQNSPEVGN